MKAKYTILIIVVGYCLDFMGTLFKIQHQGYADTALLIATILKVIGLVLLTYKIIQYEGLKEFMNK
jgi:hypothetical protein